MLVEVSGEAKAALRVLDDAAESTPAMEPHCRSSWPASPRTKSPVPTAMTCCDEICSWLCHLIPRADQTQAHNHTEKNFNKLFSRLREQQVSAVVLLNLMSLAFRLHGREKNPHGLC